MGKESVIELNWNTAATLPAANPYAVNLFLGRGVSRRVKK